MQVRQLLGKNLTFYWRTNLAVVLGVVAATAVIGGALVVGDSVRESLKQMSLDRLGRIDHAVTGGRFFREELASPLGTKDTHVAPAILIQGTVIRRERAETAATTAADATLPRVLRAGQIQVVGSDDRLWQMLHTGGISAPAEDEIVLNQRVAEQVRAAVGDQISLVVEIPASIPRDSLLGDRNETVTELTLTVSAIAPEATGLARFGLNPSQQIPANVFVHLKELQRQLELDEVRPTRRNPVSKPARVNALFFDLSGAQNPQRLAPDVAEQLTRELQEHVTLEDLALKIVENQRHPYLSLESEQMILENSLAEAALQTAAEQRAVVSPVLVYLLNEIWNPADPERYSMYSVIAGIDPELRAPFGPFEFVGESRPLQPGQVYLNDWLATDLGLGTGEKIQVKYHVVGDRGELPEDEAEFEVAGVVKLTGVADDAGFTPHVPGVTDVSSYGDWRQPFPLKEDRITKRDDLYWDNTETERDDDYRTTPKVFTPLQTAQEIWESRYGNLTSVRFAPGQGESLQELEETFRKEFLAKLEPTQTGIFVQPIKAIGLRAAQGTTDFSGLFIGLSFFLIFAATLLVGLLFRLGVESRLSELGLLMAVGMTPQQVRKLFLVEGAVLVVVGGLLGCLAAVGYAAIMIHGLKTWWIGAIGTRFLFLSVQWLSLAIGFVIACVVALGAVYWALRQTRQQSARSLLLGESTSTALATVVQNRTSRRVAWLTLGGGLMLALLTVLGVIPEREAFFGFSWQIVMFFVVGTAVLVGGLASLAAVLGSNDAVSIEGPVTLARLKLGLRNSARNRQRSVLTASLIASATFVIVAMGAGQQNPVNEQPAVRSGNGGFTFVAETNVPVLNDINTAEGRSKLGFDVLNTEQMAILDRAHVVPFRRKTGENASCLNLYQTQLPTVLGVPEDVLDEFIEQNRFLFANTPGPHPWELLRQELPAGRIPVLGDLNTLMYSLHKNIGQTVAVPNEEEARHQLEVVGMFANSVFQGVLVMSETNFRKVFPEQVGFQYFLIETPLDGAEQVASILETYLGDYGFDTDRVSQRLADFLAVQNTYLSTFQTLGGLGLLLGTIGLATVMLRNVLERRGELALLRAVGFRRLQIGLLIILENAFLLLSGLLLGTVAALLAMGPHLLGAVADVPWSYLGLLLGGVFVIGMLAAAFAVRTAIQTPILSTLRGE